WEKKITQSLERVFPELEGANVSIKPQKGLDWTGFIEFAGRTPLPIDHFGDGARHAFKVLAVLIALSEKVDKACPGLFLWEDPELFMHPATLARLLEETLRLISDKPIQMFITTQSLEVIAWLANYLDKLTDEEAARIRSHRLELKQETLQAHKFEGRSIGGWLQFFGDPRFIGEDESSSPLFRWWEGQER
ncbi:MAG: ATP-binding protein, partial [Desulfobulbaceae bacterium]|nr:ATP-binding protein [Desulfobulbaceae bacterium]